MSKKWYLGSFMENVNVLGDDYSALEPDLDLFGAGVYLRSTLEAASHDGPFVFEVDSEAIDAIDKKCVIDTWTVDGIQKYIDYQRDEGLGHVKYNCLMMPDPTCEGDEFMYKFIDIDTGYYEKYGLSEDEAMRDAVMTKIEDDRGIEVHRSQQEKEMRDTTKRILNGARELAKADGADTKPLDDFIEMLLGSRKKSEKPQFDTCVLVVTDYIKSIKCTFVGRYSGEWDK